MASVGLVEMNFLLILSGFFGGGGILGLPPGERDIHYVQAAPENVFLYNEWSPRGEGTGGGAGIDGFVADPEVKLFADSVLEATRTMFANEAGGPMETFAKSVPEMYLSLLGSSGCFYVEMDAEKAAELAENPPEIPLGMPPGIMMATTYRATVIINPGKEKADAFGKTIESLLGMMPGLLQKPGLDHQTFPVPLPGAELTLHRHENYFILGWGAGTIDRAVAALDDNADDETKSIADNPKFQAAMKKISMDRMANVVWMDLGGLLKQQVESAGQSGMVYKQMAKILGLEDIGTYAQTVGVVDGRITQKGAVVTGGQTTRLLAVLGGRALTAKDFAHIPADADFYQAWSVDWPKVLAELQTVVGDADPVALDALNGTLKQLETELELSFEDDIFPAIGQVWSIHSSPAGGGLLFTSPVLTVDVQDKAKAEKVFKRLMEVLQLAVPGQTQAGRWGRGVYLTKHEFLGKDVHFINTVGDDVPFAPAFCLTDSHIVVSLNPQAIKAHLRTSNKTRSLASTIEKRLADHSGEVLSLGYAKSEGAARAFLSVAPYISQLVFSEIQREGVPIDTFSWPSAAAFLPYLQDARSYAVRTKDSIIWHSESALPIPGMATVARQMPMFLGFSYFSMVQRRARFAPVQEAIEADAIQEEEF